MSTIRALVNNDCVATGYPTKDGGFYQMLPKEEYFTNESVWREAVSKQYAISFVSDPKKQQEKPYTYTKHTVEKLPAGRYYIGDLCYALKKSVYDDVFGDANYAPGYYTTKDGCFLVDRTAYGDGTYKGTNGHNYNVDAGIIGIASMGVCEPEDKIYGGTLHTLSEPVACEFLSGVFKFLSRTFKLTIDTAYD